MEYWPPVKMKQPPPPRSEMEHWPPVKMKPPPPRWFLRGDGEPELEPPSSDDLSNSVGTQTDFGDPKQGMLGTAGPKQVLRIKPRPPVLDGILFPRPDNPPKAAAIDPNSLAGIAPQHAVMPKAPVARPIAAPPMPHDEIPYVIDILEEVTQRVSDLEDQGRQLVYAAGFIRREVYDVIGMLEEAGNLPVQPREYY
jgi:hypothetical protein